MGRMAFILCRWRSHVRRGLLPIIMLPDGNLLLKRCTYVRFLILTIWGSVRMAETQHGTVTQSQLTVVMWAPCSRSHLTSKECNVVTKHIPIVLGHFVSRTVLQLAGGIEMINHIYFCQIIAKSGIVCACGSPCRHVFLPIVHLAGDSSGRLFYDVSRNHAGQPAYPELCAKTVGMWNRVETGCPFLPKQWFKHNVLNTSCHVIDKDGDIILVSYQTENKI